jgi:ArsR family transcriptional regulator, repressor of sdpIR and other operons
MAARIYRVSVTPRFEVFYALFALTSPQNLLVRWKRAASDKLGSDFARIANHVAPSPFMWPLLADALRTQPLEIGRDEISTAFQSMDDRTFQCDVLGGLFKREGIPEALIEGGLTLRQAVVGETTSARMLEVVGLRPFQGSNSIATAIQRVISDPRGYRGDVAQAIEKFWDRIFNEVWESLAPSFQRRAARISAAIEEHSPGRFLQETGFPINVDERRRVVTGVKGPLRISFATLDVIELFPSAFNFSRFWATYDKRDGKKTLYFPVLHPEQIPLPSMDGKRKIARGEDRVEALPAREAPSISTDEAKAAFIALGDKTRFAMATMLARSPRTSVELARAFGVSKPTVSHHVQLFRAAGLLKETARADGVVLSIDRERLESLSIAAARTMFDGTEEATVQRTRRK